MHMLHVSKFRGCSQEICPPQEGRSMPSQTSSLNGSLGPVPPAFGTESQSHISPHAYLETQACLSPDCCGAASAAQSPADPDAACEIPA